MLTSFRQTVISSFQTTKKWWRNRKKHRGRSRDTKSCSISERRRLNHFRGSYIMCKTQTKSWGRQMRLLIGITNYLNQPIVESLSKSLSSSVSSPLKGLKSISHWAKVKLSKHSKHLRHKLYWKSWVWVDASSYNSSNSSNSSTIQEEYLIPTLALESTE